MSLRSHRLAAGFAACSMTPRSGKKYVDELARCHRIMCVEEQLYAEGKLALTRHDFAVAHALLSEVPKKYKHTEQYVTQCKLYERLCEAGAVHREGTKEMREVLSKILEEPSSGVAINRYTESLLQHGYRSETVTRVTLKDVKRVATLAVMNEAHCAMLRAYAETQTALWERAWVSTLAAIEECGGVAVCMKAVVGGE